MARGNESELSPEDSCPSKQPSTFVNRMLRYAERSRAGREIFNGYPGFRRILSQVPKAKCGRRSMCSTISLAPRQATKRANWMIIIRDETRRSNVMPVKAVLNVHHMES